MALHVGGENEARVIFCGGSALPERRRRVREIVAVAMALIAIMKSGVADLFPAAAFKKFL
jgi:hypothetical protein